MKISIAPFCQYEKAKEWQGYSELMKLTEHSFTVLGSMEETGIARDFSDVTKTIETSDLFIGNDGGLYHIAAFLNVRTIVIFMLPENIFRVGHFNKPNVKIMWRPTVEEVINCI